MRVDHLSDVLWLGVEDAQFPAQWGPEVLDLDKSALNLKDEGNVAMKQDRYWDAIEWYGPIECFPLRQHSHVSRLKELLSADTG